MKFIISPLLLMLAVFSWAQQSEQDSIYEANYAERIQQTTLYGVYIPASLDEAFEQLTLLSSPEGLDKFKEAPESVVAEKLKGGLQRWIYLNWGFEKGSRLSHRLRHMGLQHPEDMSEFVLRTYHRHLNASPLHADALISALNNARQDKWDASHKTTEKIIGKQPAEPR